MNISYDLSFLTSPINPSSDTWIGQSFELSYLNSEIGNNYLLRYKPYGVEPSRAKVLPYYGDVKNEVGRKNEDRRWIDRQHLRHSRVTENLSTIENKTRHNLEAVAQHGFYGVLNQVNAILTGIQHLFSLSEIISNSQDTTDQIEKADLFSNDQLDPILNDFRIFGSRREQTKDTIKRLYKNMTHTTEFSQEAIEELYRVAERLEIPSELAHVMRLTIGYMQTLHHGNIRPETFFADRIDMQKNVRYEDLISFDLGLLPFIRQEVFLSKQSLNQLDVFRPLEPFYFDRQLEEHETGLTMYDMIFGSFMHEKEAYKEEIEIAYPIEPYRHGILGTYFNGILDENNKQNRFGGFKLNGYLNGHLLFIPEGIEMTTIIAETYQTVGKVMDGLLNVTPQDQIGYRSTGLQNTDSVEQVGHVNTGFINSDMPDQIGHLSKGMLLSSMFDDLGHIDFISMSYRNNYQGMFDTMMVSEGIDPLGYTNNTYFRGEILSPLGNIDITYLYGAMEDPEVRIRDHHIYSVTPLDESRIYPIYQKGSPEDRATILFDYGEKSIRDEYEIRYKTLFATDHVDRSGFTYEDVLLSDDVTPLGKKIEEYIANEKSTIHTDILSGYDTSYIEESYAQLLTYYIGETLDIESIKRETIFGMIPDIEAITQRTIIGDFPEIEASFINDVQLGYNAAIDTSVERQILSTPAMLDSYYTLDHTEGKRIDEFTGIKLKHTNSEKDQPFPSVIISHLLRSEREKEGRVEERVTFSISRLKNGLWIYDLIDGESILKEGSTPLSATFSTTYDKESHDVPTSRTGETEQRNSSSIQSLFVSSRDPKEGSVGEFIGAIRLLKDAVNLPSVEVGESDVNVSYVAPSMSIASAHMRVTNIMSHIQTGSTSHSEAVGSATLFSGDPSKRQSSIVTEITTGLKEVFDGNVIDDRYKGSMDLLLVYIEEEREWGSREDNFGRLNHHPLLSEKELINTKVIQELHIGEIPNDQAFISKLILLGSRGSDIARISWDRKLASTLVEARRIEEQFLSDRPDRIARDVSNTFLFERETLKEGYEINQTLSTLDSVLGYYANDLALSDRGTLRHGHIENISITDIESLLGNATFPLYVSERRDEEANIIEHQKMSSLLQQVGKRDQGFLKAYQDSRLSMEIENILGSVRDHQSGYMVEAYLRSIKNEENAMIIIPMQRGDRIEKRGKIEYNLYGSVALSKDVIVYDEFIMSDGRGQKNILVMEYVFTNKAFNKGSYIEWSRGLSDRKIKESMQNTNDYKAETISASARIQISNNKSTTNDKDVITILDSIKATNESNEALYTDFIYRSEQYDTEARIEFSLFDATTLLKESFDTGTQQAFITISPKEAKGLSSSIRSEGLDSLASYQNVYQYTENSSVEADIYSSYLVSESVSSNASGFDFNNIRATIDSADSLIIQASTVSETLGQDASLYEYYLGGEKNERDAVDYGSFVDLVEILRSEASPFHSLYLTDTLDIEGTRYKDLIKVETFNVDGIINNADIFVETFNTLGITINDVTLSDYFGKEGTTGIDYTIVDFLSKEGISSDDVFKVEQLHLEGYHTPLSRFMEYLGKNGAYITTMTLADYFGKEGSIYDTITMVDQLSIGSAVIETSTLLDSMGKRGAMTTTPDMLETISSDGQMMKEQVFMYEQISKSSNFTQVLISLEPIRDGASLEHFSLFYDKIIEDAYMLDLYPTVESMTRDSLFTDQFTLDRLNKDARFNEINQYLEKIEQHAWFETFDLHTDKQFSHGLIENKLITANEVHKEFTFFEGLISEETNLEAQEERPLSIADWSYKNSWMGTDRQKNAEMTHYDSFVVAGSLGNYVPLDGINTHKMNINVDRAKAVAWVNYALQILSNKVKGEIIIGNYEYFTRVVTEAFEIDEHVRATIRQKVSTIDEYTDALKQQYNTELIKYLMSDKVSIDTFLQKLIDTDRIDVFNTALETYFSSHRPQDDRIGLEQDQKLSQRETEAKSIIETIIRTHRENESKSAYVPENKYKLSTGPGNWDDIRDMYAKGIDVIDVPNTDFKYENLKKQVYDLETGVPHDPLGATNLADVKVKLPLHHPLPEHFDLGTNEVVVDNYVLIEVILALESFKNDKRLRYAGMPAEKAIREIFSTLYDWIVNATPNDEQYKRTFRFARWYAEHAILKLSNHILHRTYDPFKSKIHIGEDLGIEYDKTGWKYDAMGYRLYTWMPHAELSFVKENYIDGEFILRGHFDNSAGQGKMVVKVDGSVIDSITSNGAFIRRYDLPQGNHTFELIFDGTDGSSEVVSLSSVEITGCTFIDAHTTSDDSNTNGLKAAMELIKLLVAYFEKHHADDKVKGTMKINQRGTWQVT